MHYFTILIFTVISCFQVALAEPYQATVIHVWDGDSLVVSTDTGPRQIRIFGIDAPEKNQPFGQASKRYLEQLLNRRMVTVEPLEQDQYKRTIANLTFQKKSVANMLIEQGYAWAYRRYKPPQQYITLENRAKQQKQGLWKSGDAIAPWKWRKRHRKER